MIYSMHETIVTIEAVNKIYILMSLNWGEFVKKYDPQSFAHTHTHTQKALDFIGDKYMQIFDSQAVHSRTSRCDEEKNSQ